MEPDYRVAAHLGAGSSLQHSIFQCPRLLPSVEWVSDNIMASSRDIRYIRWA